MYFGLFYWLFWCICSNLLLILVIFDDFIVILGKFGFILLIFVRIWLFGVYFDGFWFILLIILLNLTCFGDYCFIFRLFAVILVNFLVILRLDWCLLFDCI